MLGDVFEVPALTGIAAALGGVILAPVFYIWVGLRLRVSSGAPPEVMAT